MKKRVCLFKHLKEYKVTALLDDIIVFRERYVSYNVALEEAVRLGKEMGVKVEFKV
ncbi:hypothetical protein [Clostridium paridis]|uniref:Uncharacterized protein n=1 Tax=Clostridium paridis TaxID=2803863 RepID=A0A937K4U9_9CLOT|nr:hypothetical protein [Clostridium paridis]MBL4932279.1 hypothetical protein [Clostridium paridis]